MHTFRFSELQKPDPIRHLLLGGVSLLIALSPLALSSAGVFLPLPALAAATYSPQQVANDLNKNKGNLSDASLKALNAAAKRGGYRGLRAFVNRVNQALRSSPYGLYLPPGANRATYWVDTKKYVGATGTTIRRYVVWPYTADVF
jgi:hypothetical protein